MRLFVALRPPGEAVDHVVAATAGPRASAAHLRWVDPGQLHVTLAFLGDVPESRRAELERRLARAAARHPPPDLELAGASRLGNRVLVMRVDGDRDRLRRLAASVTAAARRSGVAVDERRFHPHLTLARARAGDDLRPSAAALAGYRGARWTAAEVFLVHSRLGAGPGGTAEHHTIAAWPLTGRAERRQWRERRG